VNSDSATAAGVGGVTVFGRGTTYGLHDMVSLPGNEHLMHSLSYGLDYKHFNEKVAVGPNQGYTTPISYAPFSLAYSATQTDASGRWDFGAGWEFALRDFLSRQTEFDDKRYKARNNFSILRFDLARTQQLPAGLSLWAKVDGQLATQALVSNEQYVAGGAGNMRGYLDATQAGDSAVHSSLELRAPNLAGKLGAGVSNRIADLSPYLFFDAAYLELRDPLPSQQSRFELASTGAGLKLRIKDTMSLSLDLAVPLHSNVNTHAHDLHVHSSAQIEF
jgi:hemolysin activation/secretion protein